MATAGRSDVSWRLIEAQNASTTAALIERLSGEAWFEALAQAEGEALARRDAEDAEKIEAGIALSVARGVLPQRPVESEYEEIDVLGKSPDEVCDVILERVPVDERGAVVVLCGLSGTGKGTTVARLQERLGARATRWSNGDCFRALTWLAATWSEQRGVAIEAALAPENVKAFVSMLTFDEQENGWELRVDGLGLAARVSQVANTALKAPRVSRNIPTVARETQGDVVLFANRAVAKLRRAGRVVLVEGRRATLNYIDSPFRFVLAISDPALLGKRRAAQRIAAALHEHFSTLMPPQPPSEHALLRTALDLAEAMLRGD